MTRIADLLADGPTFSFEFFPPKNEAEQATLVRTLRELEPLEPSFVSVTYRGGRESRRRTHDLVVGMLRTTTLTPMAHLTCVVHSRAGAGRDPRRLPQGGHRERARPRRRPARRGRPRAPASSPTRSSWSSWPRRSAGSRSAWPPIPSCHPRSPDRATDRDHLAAKLERRRLRHHPVLLPRRALPRPDRRPVGARRRQAGRARHHADHQPQLGRSAWPSCPAPRCPPELVERLDAVGRRARRGAPHRRRDRHRAVREAARRGRARAALLHAQPLDRDPRDLHEPRPGRRA